MNPSENLTKLTGCRVVINACSVYNLCEKNKYRGEAEHCNTCDTIQESRLSEK